MTGETRIQCAARIACGWGAAHHGESSEGQWLHLAQWAGFGSWAEVEDAARGAEIEDVAPHLASPRQLAAAAADRRRRWERNSADR